MPAPASTIGASHCPLCGQANDCAMAAGLPAQHCWCMQAPISRAALARVPTEQRGQLCICPQCGQEAAAPPPPGSPSQKGPI